jgi:DNA-binding NarL/FixJ family response regulator
VIPEPPQRSVIPVGKLKEALAQLADDHGLVPSQVYELFVVDKDGRNEGYISSTGELHLWEIPMPNQSKVIAFDVDQASLISLRKALPDSAIEEVNGATAASLTRDWNPGTVDLVVVQARNELAQTLELCRFLVSCGVFARDGPVVTDSEEEMPKTLGLHRGRRNVARRPHSPLLVLVSAGQKSIVTEVLKAGAHSCLMVPIDAKDVASMLVHAQAGNQPGRHTLDLERAQTEDRWRDDGGQG